MGTLWAKARNARFLKTPLLRLLDTMTELREPLLRPTHVRASHWTPLLMHEMIGNEAANVESAMIQVNQSLGTSTNAAHQAVESNRPASTTFSSQHQAITQSSATSPQDIQPEIERTTDLADQCQAGVDWLIARKPQSRDIMRRAMANVRDNKVIHQTLINTTEAVAESVNDSTASSDQILQDNIALTVGAVATNGRNVKAIEISTQEMQAEDLMLYFRLEEAQLQLPNLNARQTRPL
ncbi:hypothetical protein PCH_Pc12g10050 [Penicillium rubens Wisconsin 54-1255]|uniref:Uncharacterized protein n=1 Tax=Penicillium rubens (strain ATCC 28089 / DSM 1075 / NRRL 1951 / Wisconsin 54-1255) TaxID=500485 RepID=B6H076_PENRW|nr:hypothetical protein PCH_Pc12g10050 [Penicillium rubens Wisconsin 54-1255]